MTYTPSQSLRTISYMPLADANPLVGTVLSDSADIGFEASAVVWKPIPDSGASCLLNQDIDNLSEWLDWLDRNILTSQCDLTNKECQIEISTGTGTTQKPIAEAIRDCVAEGAIAYNTTNADAIAAGTTTAAKLFGDLTNVIEKPQGRDTVEPGYIPYDLSCAEVSNRLATCFDFGFNGEIPKYLFGLNKLPENPTGAATVDPSARTVNLFSNSTDGLPKYQIKIPTNDTNNRFADVAVDQRLFPQNTSLNKVTNPRGGVYDPLTGSFTCAIAGWYTFDFAMQSTVYYTPVPNLQSSRVSVNFGLKHVNTQNENKAVEYRLSQALLRLWSGTSQPANSSGTALLYLNQRDSITPRIWLGGTPPTQIDIQLASSGENNRWTVFMEPYQEVYALGA